MGTLDAVALLLSAISIVQMWLAGSNHRLAWVVGLPNQTGWCVWCALSPSTISILPLNLVLWGVFARNLWRNL